MITAIMIQNFKSLKKAEIETNALTLLTGLNGVGKSSFLQSLLLIMQSNKLEEGIIRLKGSLADIGTGRDALYQFAQDEQIVLEITLDGERFLWECAYQKDGETLQSKNRYPADVINRIREIAKHLHYIKSVRFINPFDLYPISSMVSAEKQIGTMGEYAPYYLDLFGNDYAVPEILRHPKATSETLLSQINAWMKEIAPGVSLKTQLVPAINLVMFHYQFDFGNNKTNLFLPKNVGTGISDVLPVVLSLLTAGERSLRIIENPESHIHPRGQAEIGRLIALAAQNGAQLFIETHSDHILNGVRVAVKEQKVDENKVTILFFDREVSETEQYAQITPIQIDKNGSLNNYPDNFMDEWSNQLSKLI